VFLARLARLARLQARLLQLSALYRFHTHFFIAAGLLNALLLAIYIRVLSIANYN
jgi:hypothetical protein